MKSKRGQFHFSYKLTSAFWYAVTAMNWVSGKVKVWVQIEGCTSSTSPCLASVTCRRGWYLCKDCSTIICQIHRTQFIHTWSVSCSWTYSTPIMILNVLIPMLMGWNPITWVILFDAPLLLVSFSFPKEISCRIQWAPVLGESGCMYVRFPARRMAFPVSILQFKYGESTY